MPAFQSLWWMCEAVTLLDFSDAVRSGHMRTEGFTDTHTVAATPIISLNVPVKCWSHLCIVCGASSWCQAEYLQSQFFDNLFYINVKLMSQQKYLYCNQHLIKPNQNLNLVNQN